MGIIGSAKASSESFPLSFITVFQIAVRGGGRGGNFPPPHWKFHWGRIFLPGEGNLRRSDFDNSNLF